MTLDSDISNAVRIIRQGGIILYPTDTVWGIGCDAGCSDAVKRIFALKRRVDSKAMLSLVGSRTALESVVGSLDPDVETLVMSERPTTVIFSHVSSLCPELVAPDGSAALRLTREEFSRRLCEEAGVPVVSTSANISGHPAPALFADIDPQIVAGVDYIVHYRRTDTDVSAPSRIVMLMPDRSVKILRP